MTCLTPESTTADSLDFDLDTFREQGHRTIEMMAGYLAGVRSRRVFPECRADELAGAFADPMPEKGVAPAAILDDWEQRVLPNLSTVGSPRHFAYVNGSGTMMSILADALAACVNTNTGAWKLGPAGTEIERQTVRWIAGLLGYPQDTGGLFVSGGTMANFTALMAALRNHPLAADSTAQGLQSPDRRGRFLLYMSDHEGHVSIGRVADMLNLGREAVVRIPSRGDFTIDPEALERRIVDDLARGDIPFCVVAQVGSINVGAIDPLDTLADICRRHGLWLHGDGACGGAGAMLPEKRPAYAGLERLDSLSLDPHKWLSVSHDCGLVMVRDAEKLRRTFSMSAPYLRGILAEDACHGTDYLEYGTQMSRGFRALKVWMSLRQAGAEGYRRVLRKHIRLAEHLHSLVRQTPDFEVLHSPNLFIYSCRFAPPHLRAGDAEGDAGARQALDLLNQQIAERVQQSGFASLMTSRLAGKVVLRFSICSHRVTREDIEATFETVKLIARSLQA